MTKKASTNLSIDKKFFRNMLSVSVMFMLLLLVSISFFFYGKLVNQESSSTLHELDYISRQLHYYLTSADNYSKTIAVDERVQAYVSSFNNGYVTANNSDPRMLISRINSIIQSTAFIHSVSLYSKDCELIAATDPYPNPVSAIQFSITDSIQFLTVQKHPYTTREKSIEVLSFIRPFYELSSGRLVGYIEIAIPETVISAIYKENLSQNTHIYMIDTHGLIRSSDRTEYLTQPYPYWKTLQDIKDKNYFFTDSSIAFYRYFKPLKWYLTSEISLSSFIMPLLSLFVISLLIAMLCILFCTFVSHRVSRSITSPINRLISHTKKIKDGNWIPIDGEQGDTEITTLFESFNSMVRSQERMKNDLLESEKMKRQISLDLLQQQINPHFLYNTLDNICSLAEIDEKEALINIVMNLSAFYRTGLSNGKFRITIKDELELTRAYLNIMKVRYVNKFDFTIHCPKSLYHYECIKLLLQPIVENSIYHGIKEIDYPGKIRILVTDDHENIIFTIIDNGIGFSPETYEQIWQDDSGHFGVKNIHQRIQLYYGTDYGLQMSNCLDGGCKTIITLEKREVKNEHAESAYC